jgi:hypothetical protein
MVWNRFVNHRKREWGPAYVALLENGMIEEGKTAATSIARLAERALKRRKTQN